MGHSFLQYLIIFQHQYSYSYFCNRRFVVLGCNTFVSLMAELLIQLCEILLHPRCLDDLNKKISISELRD